MPFVTTINNEFTLTETAQKKVQTLLAEEEKTKAIRIFVSGGGCNGMRYGMRFAEKPTDYDAVLDSNGIRIVTDAVALSYLHGVSIDFVENETSTSFVFNNAFQATNGSGGCSSCAGST